jgi:hypothetical protein
MDCCEVRVVVVVPGYDVIDFVRSGLAANVADVLIASQDSEASLSPVVWEASTACRSFPRHVSRSAANLGRSTHRALGVDGLTLARYLDQRRD